MSIRWMFIWFLDNIPDFLIIVHGTHSRPVFRFGGRGINHDGFKIPFAEKPWNGLDAISVFKWDKSC